MLILGQQHPGLTNQAGGTGKHYDPINGQGLYMLQDGKNIIYAGRGDAPKRKLNSYNKG